MLSVIATSTYWPSPVARACQSAAIVPNAANRPGTVSPAPPPTLTGCSASSAGDAHPSAHRLRDDVERRPLDVGAVAAGLVAEAAHRGVDEARIDGLQRLVAEAHACRARRRGSSRPARRRRTRPSAGACPRRASGRSRSSACCGCRPGTGRRNGAPSSSPERSHATEEVAFGRLDLDDVGAVVGEHLRAERSCQCVRQVEDAHALQGASVLQHVVSDGCMK